MIQCGHRDYLRVRSGKNRRLTDIYVVVSGREAHHHVAVYSVDDGIVDGRDVTD